MKGNKGQEEPCVRESTGYSGPASQTTVCSFYFTSSWKNSGGAIFILVSTPNCKERTEVLKKKPKLPDRREKMFTAQCFKYDQVCFIFFLSFPWRKIHCWFFCLTLEICVCFFKAGKCESSLLKIVRVHHPHQVVMISS